MKTLERYWRIFSTGLCFTLFGLGGLVLSFILLPITRLLYKQQETRECKAQNIIQKSFSLFCQLMKYTGTMDYKITGAELLAQDKGCLVVANHPSLIDYVLIVSQLPRCDCLVKSAIWSNPFMKRIVEAAGYIPNESPDDLLDACEARLSQGSLLLVFPEGTRTTLGDTPKLQRGAAQIAVRTQSDLRIVHITVTPSFLTKEQRWYQVTETKPFFHIEVKHKLEIKPFIEQTNSPTAAARRLNQHLAEVLIPQS